MKKLLILLTALTCATSWGLSPKPLRTSITLLYDYPKELETADLIFKLYASTNLALPMTNWVCVATTGATNRSISLTGVTPGVHFYSLTSSNYWGESDFSNAVGTPPVPIAGVLRLGE